MADAKARALCYFLWLIFFLGTESFAQDMYTNVWAVKVRGSQQEAEQLVLKLGFSYETHVSTLNSYSFTVKLTFSYRNLHSSVKGNPV